MDFISLWAIIRKDLQLFLRDRRSLYVAFAVPIAIASFFGYITTDRPEGNGGISVWIAVEDESAVSKRVVEKLQGENRLTIRLATAAEVRRAVVDGKAAIGLVFPHGFGDDSIRGFFSTEGKPEITLIKAPSRSMETGIVEGLLFRSVIQVVSQEAFSGQAMNRQIKEALAFIEAPPTQGSVTNSTRSLVRKVLRSLQEWLNLTNSAQTGNGVGTGPELQSIPSPFPEGLQSPFVTKSEDVFGGKRKYNGYAHSFGGMTLQFILMATVDAASALLVERRRGFWTRLRAAPVSRTVLLWGRGLSIAVTAIGTQIACWSFAMIVFGVRVEGSWLGFLLINLSIAALAASFGLFLAAIGKTPEATRGLSIFAVLLLVMLGGAWVPSFMFPSWLQELSRGFPTRWAVDGLDAMTWRGLGMSEAWMPALVVFGSAAVLGWLANRWFCWDTD